MNWKQLRPELRAHAPKFRFFNDKRKGYRRIKLWGFKNDNDKKDMMFYLMSKYPNFKIHHSDPKLSFYNGSWNGHYSGICFHMPLEQAYTTS